MKIKINKNKIYSLRNIALVLVVTVPMTLTGCSKKVDCNIQSKHAHLYQNNTGFVRYINKEYSSYEGYTRQEEYINIEGQEDLYKFLDNKNLIPIKDNIDLILKTQELNNDYKEYRYRYIYMQPIPHTVRSGKTTRIYYTYMPQARYSWTTNLNRSGLTGEERICHYVYIAYKVEKNEKGKYVLIPSEQVEDLSEIAGEYPYIKRTFHKIVTLDGKEADYEDGQEEELNDAEKNRIEEYYKENPDAKYELEKGQSYVKR